MTGQLPFPWWVRNTRSVHAYMQQTNARAARLWAGGA